MQDALRAELYRQAVQRDEFAKARTLTIDELRAKITPPLVPDDMVAPMIFSARLLGLDERSRFVGVGWATDYAGHIEDAQAVDVPGSGVSF